MAIGGRVSLRRKTYLLLWAGVLVAAALVVVVIKTAAGRQRRVDRRGACLVRSSVMGVLVVLAIGVLCRRRAARCSAKSRAGPRASGGGFVRALLARRRPVTGKARVRWQKRWKSYRPGTPIWRRPTVNCSSSRRRARLLGSSLNISDALAQLEDAALGIFDAEEVWLLRLNPEDEQLVGMRAFSDHPEGFSRLPAVFGCWGPQASIPVHAQGVLMRAALWTSESHLHRVCHRAAVQRGREVVRRREA